MIFCKFAVEKRRILLLMAEIVIDFWGLGGGLVPGIVKNPQDKKAMFKGILNAAAATLLVSLSCVLIGRI